MTRRLELLALLNEPAITNSDCIVHAYVALQLAREYLKEGGASRRPIDRVRHAISSTKGAIRHAEHRSLHGPGS